MRPEYVDEVTETGFGNTGKVHGGNLQYNGGGQSGVFLGGGIFQLLGAGPTLFGRGLAGGLTEHMEVEKSLGKVREVAEEGGSGTYRHRKVLL